VRAGICIPGWARAHEALPTRNYGTPRRQRALCVLSTVLVATSRGKAALTREPALQR
jgi:hypothetical protein